MSGTVGYGGGESAGVHASVTTTAGYSQSWSNSSAHAIGTSNTQDFSSSCNLEIDLETHNLHKVWQWQVIIPVNNTPVKINTCEVTCTADDTQPTLVPGSKELIGSCY